MAPSCKRRAGKGSDERYSDSQAEACTQYSPVLMFYLRVPWPTMLACARATATPERLGNDAAVGVVWVRVVAGSAVGVERALATTGAVVEQARGAGRCVGGKGVGSGGPPG